jgi:hypothetical protein
VAGSLRLELWLLARHFLQLGVIDNRAQES